VDNLHTIDANWREAQAIAFEERAKAVSHWLDHTEDLVAMFETDETIASELRSVAGTLRARRNDFDSAAEKLRSDLIGRNGKKE